LDTLSRRLQESVQLRTHKYFRVAVPQALTGQSLVALVGEKGYAEDEAEAVHLATLLLQHGYLFPVIEPALTVRDDGTLYRLQRPYFWPSHATQTDNVEYETLPAFGHSQKNSSFCLQERVLRYFSLPQRS
ncbi:domain found in Dishevelled, Egl-10, and Pleckstrin, partial [Ancylostoma duodenale]